MHPSAILNVLDKTRISVPCHPQALWCQMWQRRIQIIYDGTEVSCANGDSATGKRCQTNDTFKHYTTDAHVKVN